MLDEIYKIYIVSDCHIYSLNSKHNNMASLKNKSLFCLVLFNLWNFLMQ